MTNQQQASEARTDFEHRHAIRQGHEIAASDRYFEARPQIDSSDRRKAFQAGFERGWDRHAALVEAQQPATHVQQSAEIEHNTCDVSKNGVESNMAQQPAPSAAAAGWWRKRANEIEAQVAMTGSPEAMRCFTDMLTLLQAATVEAPQPSPAPQADSQPALDEREAFEAWYIDQVRSKTSVPNDWSDDDIRGAWLSRPSDAYRSSWAGQSWEAWKARAARAPADSVTAPAGGEIDRLRAALVYVAFALHGKPKYMLAEGIALIDGDTVRVSRDGWTVEASINPARATPPAQAADSVLEDAARWQELREQHESDEALCCVFAPNDMRECLVPVGSLPGELDAFMDAERAARKQGANHDHT